MMGVSSGCGLCPCPCGDMVLCESMMMGVATNIVAVRPTLYSISKQ